MKNYRLPNYIYKFPYKGNVLAVPQGSEEQSLSSTCVLYPDVIYPHQANTHPMLPTFHKYLPSLIVPELHCINTEMEVLQLETQT